MKFVIGLGNPGKRYEQTRHNIGFDVVSRFADRVGLSDPSRAQLKCLTSVGRYSSGDETIRLLLGKPQDFMNRSGGVVSSLMAFYKVKPADIIIVHDEIALPFGTIRCKRAGGHAGHNGLRDIIQHCGSDFLRLRFGVGPKPEGWDTAKYVLGKWTSKEELLMSQLEDHSCELLEHILQFGIESAMNQYNSEQSQLSNVG